MSNSQYLYFDYQYKILNQVSEVYKKLDMSDILLVSCQHLLSPQLAMYSSFFGAGLKPENCLIVGKNYSTNEDALSELRGARCPVAPISNEFDPLKTFDTWFAPHVRAWVDDILSERNMRKIRRIIVLDNGGYVHEAMYRLYGNNKDIVGVEQTSSGKTRIESLGIKFNQHMVSSNVYKQQSEARFISTLGAQLINDHICSRGMKSPRILVLGMGMIGRNTAVQLYLKHDIDVEVTDIRYNYQGSSDLKSSDIIKMFEGRGLRKEYSDVMRDISKYDVIIGATGRRSMDMQHVQNRIKKHASLISMSSGDVEFDALLFRSPRHRVHDYCMMGDMCLVNAGFPIIFRGNVHEIHPLQIEMTIAQLQASVMDLAWVHQHTSEKPRYDTVITQAYKSWKKELIEREFVAV